jgi:hypothetical protein
MNDLPIGDDPKIREALEELQLYLSDSIPPLFFAESVKVLMQVPPRLIAAQIIAWAMGQQSPGGPLPTADYIFHAAKKIHMLSELDLMPGDTIAGFLAQLGPELLAGCPEADRASLANDLGRLDLEVTMAPPGGGVDVVYTRRTSAQETGLRPRSAASGSPTPVDDELRQMSQTLGRGLQKLDYLLSRVPATSTAAGPVGVAALDPQDLAAHAVSQAAGSLENAKEMENFLQGLKSRGLPSTPDGLLGMLANNLPDWAPPPLHGPSQAEPPQAAVRAMRRFISLAGDQEESQKRFDELVDTAVGEFNKGSLGRAVTLLDLAGSMATRKEVDGVFAQSVQRRAHAKIDMDVLRKVMESEDKHHLLRRFIGFFHLFSPAELLLELEEQENRDRRRFLLDLLLVHGDRAREAVFDDLGEAATGSATFPWYYKRNLIYLLRTIPRDAETPVETEIDVLVGNSKTTDPLPLLRETLGALGQLRSDRAVSALAATISELEEALLGERELPHEPDQLRNLLDSAVKALVRMSMPEARRAVVAHGLKRKSELGYTLERLTWLSEQDMSKEPDLVGRLIREIRAELPKKVFGLTLKTSRKDYVVESLLKTLSSTNTAPFRELLTEIGRDYEGQPFIKTAERIREGFSSPGSTKKTSSPTLSGDLELFGLPNLLQNLADSQIGGVLRIYDRSGEVSTEIWLEEGRVLGARGERLNGEVAILELLEAPTPGRFELAETDGKIPHEARTREQLSIQSILFEGIRRYDEFKRAASVVPDEARYQAAGGQPTLPEGETDAELFKEVWRLASAGSSPVECEQELPVDRYRIRCLFEHWQAEGVLVQIGSGIDSPPAG